MKKSYQLNSRSLVVYGALLIMLLLKLHLELSLSKLIPANEIIPVTDLTIFFMSALIIPHILQLLLE